MVIAREHSAGHADGPAVIPTPTGTSGRNGGPRTGRRFDVWAPAARSVTLVVAGDPMPMRRRPGAGRWDGWWQVSGAEPQGEVDYGYLIDSDDAGDARLLPDPRSRRQPRGVHGPSRTFDPQAFTWTDQTWPGRKLKGCVLYELHVGTFTPEGTLDAALQHLDHLRDLGIDAIEVMPVNAFDGTHGWGYDGVAWFAVHEPYGGPAAYQRFVDRCHRNGLAVIQDVVYNHLGPSGNYLPQFGPYLAHGTGTAWGSSLNLDGYGSWEVRRYILDNVRMWFEDFHVDGLRLDAVQALADTTEPHLLAEIGREADQQSAQLRRPVTIIAECDPNDPALVLPRESGGLGLDAMCNDDFHHALHTALTGETHGYYSDFRSLSTLANACQGPWFHAPTRPSPRQGPADQQAHTQLPPARLVISIQNHDQIGNRPRGDRLTQRLDDDQLACAALLTLTAPFTPMIFQGEEWAASSPFPFFTSFSDTQLGRAVSKGRRNDLRRMGWDQPDALDPQDPSTFDSARLDWSELSQERHRLLLDVHRDLLRIRRTLPALTASDVAGSCDVDDERSTFVMRRANVLVAVNFGTETQVIELGPDLQLLWATPSGVTIEPTRLCLPRHAGALLRAAAPISPSPGRWTS